MKWKALFAVIIILGIVGLLFITDTGKKYTEFLRVKIGDFLNVITLRRARPDQVFGMTLIANKEPLYGHSYNVKNSDFSGTGFYQYIKVGDHVIAKKSEEKVDIILTNFNGMFEYTSDGILKLTGESRIEIDDYVFSSENPIHMDIEIVPFSFSLTNIEQDGISLQSVSGNIKTDRGEAPLENSKLEISFFTGSLSLAEDGTIMLEGTVGSVTGDKFSFSE